MGARISREAIDLAIDNFIEKYNRTPKQKEFGPKAGFGLPSAPTVGKIYGTVTKYFENRKITPNQIYWNKDKIKEVVLPKILDRGRMLTAVEINNLSKKDLYFPTEPTISKHYGSLNIFLDECSNIEPIQLQNYWDKELCLEAIKNNTTNEMLSAKEIDKLSKTSKYFPSQRTLSRYGLTLETIAKELNIQFIGERKQQSAAETEIFIFIQEIYDGMVDRQNKTILNGKHIDIYLPQIKVGIEYNGNYWHSIKSREPKNSKYHIAKTILAKESGVLLCHIFEYEWENNKQEMEQYLIQLVKNETIHYSTKVGSKIELDNRFPLKYDNLKVIEITEPQLKKFGNQQCWDCGTTTYEVI